MLHGQLQTEIGRTTEANQLTLSTLGSLSHRLKADVCLCIA
jgi:hypothetical protein